MSSGQKYVHFAAEPEQSPQSAGIASDESSECIIAGFWVLELSGPSFGTRVSLAHNPS